MMFFHRRTRVLGILSAAIAICCLWPVGGQSAPQRNPAGLLQQAVRELTAEARIALQDGAITRRSPTFAAAFLRERDAAADSIPPQVAWNALRRKQNNDPFIDAYIRWQLTGFNPQPPDEDSLAQEQFERFLVDLPPYLFNPRSESQVVYRVNAALARTRLTDEQAAEISALNKDLIDRSRSTIALNAPAIALRVWIEQNVSDRGMRIHQIRLERIAAMVAGGWNPDQLKRRMTRDLEAAVKDYAFTPAQRARVAQQMTRTAGRRTPIVTRVSVEESVATAQFDEAAVYDFEVREWIRTMQGKT